MRCSFWLRILLALAVVVTPLVASMLLMPRVASAAPAAPIASTDDEIILLESNGRIRVDDPYVIPGTQQAVWNSGTDIGWALVAAGDFNGDGDAEIVAASGNALKVFDPWPVSSVMYQYALPTGRSFRLLVTGDFDKDGRDEIAAAHTDSGTGVVESVKIFDGGATGATWSVSWGASFNATWRDIAVGDLNNDDYDDLVLVRNIDRRVVVYRGGTTGLTTLANQGSYATDWWSVMAGNIFAGYGGDEMALVRDSANAVTNSLILLRVSGSALVDIGGGANYKYNPDFTSLALGDLNGDGDDEVVMLRDPTVAGRISLLMVNPSGVAMRDFKQIIGYGSTAWKLVRAGDIDGDSQDEVIVLRGDRYRIYTEPELSDSFPSEMLGSFRVSTTPSNTSTMVVANVDGGGIVQEPTLGVTPQSLAFDLEYNQFSSMQTVRISNAGSTSSIAWQATVAEGAGWLKIDKTSGVTPADLEVSVDASALPPAAYTGRIRVSATTAGVINPQQDIAVQLTVKDPGFVVMPSQLTILQGSSSSVVTKAVRIGRPGGTVNWNAAAFPAESLAEVAEKLASGEAALTADGLQVDGIQWDPPAWLAFTPSSGTTSYNGTSTMTVSIKPGTAIGTYNAIIVVVASTATPDVPDRVQYVEVTGIVAERVSMSYLPLTKK